MVSPAFSIRSLRKNIIMTALFEGMPYQWSFQFDDSFHIDGTMSSVEKSEPTPVGGVLTMSSMFAR